MFSQRFCKVCHGGGEMEVQGFCLRGALETELDWQMVYAPVEPIVAEDSFEDVKNGNQIALLLECKRRLIDDLGEPDFMSTSLISSLYRYLFIFDCIDCIETKRTSAGNGEIFPAIFDVEREVSGTAWFVEYVIEIARRLNEANEGLADWVTGKLRDGIELLTARKYFRYLAALVIAILKARHLVESGWRDSPSVTLPGLRQSHGGNDHN